MGNENLSHEEMKSLLSDNQKNEEQTNIVQEDVLGEIGNICMGSAATTLSKILHQKVLITTPKVDLTTLKKIKENLKFPNFFVNVSYVSGIDGDNILILKTEDAKTIAEIVLNKERTDNTNNFDDMEISVLEEVMNQMVGTSATALAQMLRTNVSISTPYCAIMKDESNNLSDHLKDSDMVVKVEFKLLIGDIVDSTIMQIISIDTAERIVDLMLNGSSPIQFEQKNNYRHDDSIGSNTRNNIEKPSKTEEINKSRSKNKVEISKALFNDLENTKENFNNIDKKKNINLILDVPLEISVSLGKTHKTIKEILALTTGSLIELQKLAEEPVDILVNGKNVAVGEVVIIDEYFGVRITEIINSDERIKSLK